MQKAKCRNEKCGKILGPDDRIYQIRTGYINGCAVFAPCCSRECAEAVQKKLADGYMAQYNDVMGQSFQIMPLSMFGAN